MALPKYEKLKIEILKLAFPIGQPYVTQENKNPSEILGFGTWERTKGKVLVGLDEDDTYFNEIGKTGGSKTHTQTIDEMPSHTHGGFWDAGTATQGGNNYNVLQYFKSGGWNDGVSFLTGKGQPMNIMNPYKVVGYMWVRVA